MLARSRRSLFSVNLIARRTTSTCVQSKPLPYFQEQKFSHGFSCDSMMYGRKRRIDLDLRKGKIVTQIWRAVSTQPNCYEGDSERGKLQSPPEKMHHAISSTVVTPVAETSSPEVSSEPNSTDTRPTAEASKDDTPLDEKLVPPEKHSVSMDVGWSLMRFIKGKGGEDFITIEGNSAESVTKASEKIQVIVDKAVNSRDLDYSHFVSLPLAIHPGLVDKLVNFQNTIIGIAASGKDKNVDSNTDGVISDEEEEDEDQQSHTVSSAVVKLEAEKDDAHVKADKTSNQHSSEVPLVAKLEPQGAVSNVAVKLEAEKDDAHVKEDKTSNQHSTEVPLVAKLEPQATTNTSNKVNITNIPLVSYRPKESKTPGSGTISSKSKELWNKDRVKVAAEILQSVSSKVMDALENKPVLIRLKGLECMRGSKAKAHILYAPVEEIGSEERLLRACQVIADAFVEAGLVIQKDVQQKLKLHATVMNAHHRKRKKRSRKLDSFDARGIFDLYGSEEWGEYPICEAHLSQRFVFDENGYYHCCASIPFPGARQVD
ncbi:hypothetical protein OROHE_003855 [Orobanche hederae]